jgi:hypothetical protein
LLSIILLTRYNHASGRLRIKLVLKNISIKRRAAIRTRVTVGWK